MNGEYQNPYGYSGVGSDIGWCHKWSGGKRCMLCKHYAEFAEWSQTWNWYYLIRWSDYPVDYYHNFAHFGHEWVSRYLTTWGGAPYIPSAYRVKPIRYRTRGLKERDIKQLLKRGCKPKRKCQCVSIAQRGEWYCPDCWYAMNQMAKYKGMHIHTLMLGDHEELKAEMLVLRLSGTL